MKIKSPSKKKTVVGLTFLGITLLTGAGLFWNFGATAKKEMMPEQIIRPVKIVSLSETTLKETRSFPGLVNAARETKLAFRVSGPLVAFDVRIGRHVKEGDVIARIDSRDFEINLMRLSAALGEARANLKAMKTGARAEDIARLEAELTAVRARLTNAKRDFERQKNLLAERAVSQVRYDEAKAGLDTAKANVEGLVQELKKAKSGARIEEVEAAEAGIRKLSSDIKAAEHALGDTELKAPFSGYVSHRYVENFENVRAGEPIVSFLDVSNVEVDSAVPEDLVIRRSLIADIYCTLDAYPGHRFDATVKEIGRKTDSANQSYPVTVILKVPEGIVVEPDMAATLHVSLNSPVDLKNGFSLPASAVFSDPEGQACIWRVDMQTLRVIKTPITTGKLQHGTIQVVSGLSAGDRVVIAGARFLQDNQKIRILDQIEGKAS